MVVKRDVKSLMPWRNFQGRFLFIYLFKFWSFDTKIMYADSPELSNTKMFKEHPHCLTLGFFKLASPDVPTVSIILFLLPKNMCAYKKHMCLSFFSQKWDHTMHIIL